LYCSMNAGIESTHRSLSYLNRILFNQARWPF
jgi:hypothetical protein